MKKILLNHHKKTTCPNCSHHFDIHQNRIHRIREKTNIVWFFDALTQFVHFHQVKCTNCGEIYDAPEARLFGVFKSPYTVIVLAVLFNLIWMTYVYFFEFRR